MDSIYGVAGSLAGAAGALICLVAVVGRIMGNYYIAGFEAVTLFLLGTGLMVFAVLVQMQRLLRRLGSRTP